MSLATGWEDWSWDTRGKNLVPNGGPLFVPGETHKSVGAVNLTVLRGGAYALRRTAVALNPLDTVRLWLARSQPWQPPAALDVQVETVLPSSPSGSRVFSASLNWTRHLVPGATRAYAPAVLRPVFKPPARAFFFVFVFVLSSPLSRMIFAHRSRRLG